MEKQIYFVYALVDPRNQKIFYIGKGKNRRPFDHLAEAKSGVKTFKCRRIRKILNAGFSCYDVVYLHTSLSEEEAFNLEKQEIQNHLPSGYLTNISLGGAGGDNISNNPSRDEIIEKMRQSQKERFSIPENCKKQAHYSNQNGMFGKTHTQEARQKISEKLIGRTFENRYSGEELQKAHERQSKVLKKEYENGRQPSGCYRRVEVTEEQIEKIRELAQLGLSACRLEAEIGLSIKVISKRCSELNLELKLENGLYLNFNERYGEKIAEQKRIAHSKKISGPNNPNWKGGPKPSKKEVRMKQLLELDEVNIEELSKLWGIMPSKVKEYISRHLPCLKGIIK